MSRQHPLPISISLSGHGSPQAIGFKLSPLQPEPSTSFRAQRLYDSAAMDLGEPTQATQNTQGVLDPRRLGRNNSGMTDSDISDVMCVLHPCSPAAFKIVRETYDHSPHNVLQNDHFDDYADGVTPDDLEEQETFILSEEGPSQAMDLALRFSAPVKSPHLGFVFGRHQGSCDVVLAQDTYKRVSNMHFRIFINNSGVLMLQDMSTNGTIVDDVVLKGKVAREPQTRMLNPGSIIQILSPKSDEVVKFIVRIPSREGHANEYQTRVQAYLQKVGTAELKMKENNVVTRGIVAAQKTQNAPSIKAPLVGNQFGMHWSGGDKYNVVGRIGKGAFATVFQLATKSEGQLYAAKELEKRKFIKNGVLDRKLDNEMQIMKSVSHRHIVQYVEYQDHANHMYIIMEFVPGGDLQEYLSTYGALPQQLAKTMAAQVLDALSYLHRKKITHRDIKPDNILLANLDPFNFTVKLSDFGLSKVVQDNDTFLKTFCGTLLYCAPEVFPHYDTHVGGKKRTRQGKAQQASKFHSYSQSVDIWSFGAVLWFSLCVKPPFEGVADNTGRGMFDKIMMTPLDITDLVEIGVAEDAVALLIAMLNTDPSARPSAAECSRHRWFAGPTADITQLGPTDDLDIEQGLVAIAEEEEAEAGDEPDVSGLSLDEQDSGQESQTSEVSIHSGSLEFLDPRQSKRLKSEVHAYRDRDEMIDSSPEMFYQSIPIMHQPEAGQAAAASVKPRKLFGEISQSALRSSGALGHRVGVAVGTSGTSEDEAASFGSDDGVHLGNARGAVASPSLLGAESMVREMNMDSPHPANSREGEPNEPGTPKTPGTAARAANGINRQRTDGADDVTPRPPQPSMFSRQINIPIPASFYYEASDPSTHNLEYASKKSGRDYTSNENYLDIAEDTSLPATRSGSATEHEDEVDLDEMVHNFPQPPPQEEFIKPPPRLGRLTTTADSFTSITLNLSTKLSHWGREPSNTHPYPEIYDTRIPKRAFAIWFHARGIDNIPESQQNWMKLPDLHCVISTESRHGIMVNGIIMKKGEKGRTAFGRIYTGDVVTVLQGIGSQEGKSALKFVCEFFHGEAKEQRKEGGVRFKVETESTSQPLQREKSRSKSKEKEKENIAVGAEEKTVYA